MFEALLKSFPMAIGLALSPLPMIAIVMLLMTPQAKRKSPFFFVGWIFGILGIGTLIILLPGIVSYNGVLINTPNSVKVILGIIVLIAIYPIWKKRPKPGAPIKIPKLFIRIDKFGVKRSFFLGLMLSGVNIKNVILTSSGAAQIRGCCLGNYSEMFLVLIIFSMIGSLSIIIPISIYFLSTEKMDLLFLNLRNWLIGNNSNIIIVILIAFGSLLIYNGLIPK